MNTIKSMYVDQVINNANGHFITVTFTKKDGTVRTINGRTGVRRYLRGGKATVSAKEYIILYSIQDKGYRAINKAAIMKINYKGTTLLF